MISGFNTDIAWDGVTYHVQTEDKGLATPLILSLVYVGGTILASKRSPYDDLVEKGFDELELEERVQRQHKLICAAIRAGRIEDLKRMSAKDPLKQPDGLVVRKPEKSSKPRVQNTPAIAQKVEPTPVTHSAVNDLPEITLDVPVADEVSSKVQKDVTGSLEPIPQPENRLTAELEAREKRDRELESTPVEKPTDEPPVEAPAAESPGIETPQTSDLPVLDKAVFESSGGEVAETIYDIPMVEAVEIVESSGPDGEVVVEEEFVLPADAVKVLGELDALEEAFEDELKVKILGSEDFESGDRKNVNVLVFRGNDEQAVAGAGIMVKVLGSDFRPQIFHAVADSNGVAAVSVTIPDFRSGRAAVLVRAMVGNEEAEIRRSIQLKDV